MVRVSDDARLKLLGDHYRDTFSYLEAALRTRDRLFGAVLGVLTLMLFQAFAPGAAKDCIEQAIVAKLGLATAPDICFVGSLIWFLLLSLIARYYQTTMHIERQYDYMHRLEVLLSREYRGRVFDREGKLYLGSRRLFSRWMHFLYNVVFPVVLAAVLTLRILSDQRSGMQVGLLLTNWGIYSLIIVCIVLYLVGMHCRK